MGWYEYTGLTSGGQAVTGRIEAPARAQASEALAAMRLDVHELGDAGPPVERASGLSSEDLMFFNDQLGSLAESGIALDEGLAQLARDIESPKLRRWIEEIVFDLRQGRSLEEAIARRERDLPVLYSQVVRAGAKQGRLPELLLNLNEHLRLMGATRKIIWESISYPLIVVLLALVISVYFAALVFPKSMEIFEEMDTPLPKVTLFMAAVSRHIWTILGVCVLLSCALVLVWWSLRWSESGRSMRDRFIESVPLLGRVHRASVVARFLRGVAAAVDAGAALPEAVMIGAGATGNTLVLRDATRIADRISQGDSIYAASQGAHVIPPLFGYCVQSAVGRQMLPESLRRLASSYESRAIHHQSMIRVLTMPASIVLVGAIISVGVFSLFMPIVSWLNTMTSGY